MGAVFRPRSERRRCRGCEVPERVGLKRALPRRIQDRQAIGVDENVVNGDFIAGELENADA